MKFVTFMAGAVLVFNSLASHQDASPRCLYYAETPTGVEAFYGLEDAQEYLIQIGIDPANTPEGYDITSRPGC